MAHYHDPWIGVPDDRSGPTKPGCWYPECNCEQEGTCEHALTGMRHKIHQGDALDLIPTLGRFDLVVTDPPYVIGAVSAGTLNTKAGTWGDMMNSSRWFTTWYSQVKTALRPDGALWTFCNWRSLPVVMKAAIDAQWSVASVLVWDKEWIGPGGHVGLRPTYELVALLAREDFVIPDRGLSDLWRGHQWAAHKPNGHPAEKPVSLLRRLIVASDKEGGRILDPFAGSGSTLRAALDCGCEAVVSRLRNAGFESLRSAALR